MKSQTDTARNAKEELVPKKPTPAILSREELQGGDVVISRKSVFVGDSVDENIMLILEEEEYRDLKVRNMQAGVIFTLLCDMAASYQILRHFPEAIKCLKEAEVQIGTHYQLLIGQALNIFLNKKAHSIFNLAEARRKVEAALAIVQGQISDFEDENSNLFAGYSDAITVSAFANKLADKIQKQVQMVEDTHLNLLNHIAAASLRSLKAQKRKNPRKVGVHATDSLTPNRLYPTILRPKLKSNKTETICRM